jgi:methyl acetate hydrolase
MGGHALYGTVADYLRFIRMWLNDGEGEHGAVLKPETVRMAARNHLGDLKVGKLPGVIPAYSNYYWIDRANGYGGFWATQTLPFGDGTAFGSYLEFETALYASLDVAPKPRASAAARTRS